jgi:hypothetical protein
MRKSLYFLGILNDSDIDWLIAAGHRREIAAGVNLIEEGVPTDSVFLVIDGQFSVRTAALETREIARLMSGEMLGEMSFVDSAPPSATVRALERSFFRFHAAVSMAGWPRTTASPDASIKRSRHYSRTDCVLRKQH